MRAVARRAGKFRQDTAVRDFTVVGDEPPEKGGERTSQSAPSGCSLGS